MDDLFKDPNALDINDESTKGAQFSTENIDTPLLSRSKISLLFVVWSKYHTSQEKADLVYRILKTHQEQLKRRNLKVRRQFDLTKDAIRLLIYLSTVFFSGLNDLLRDHHAFIVAVTKNAPDPPTTDDFWALLNRQLRELCAKSVTTDKLKKLFRDVVEEATSQVATSMYAGWDEGVSPAGISPGNHDFSSGPRGSIRRHATEV